MKKNIEVDFLGMDLGYDFNDLKRKIIKFDPDLIGISMFTLRYLFHYKLICEIKNVFPNISLVAGGPHVPHLSEDVLTECSEIDFGVVKDGEETLFKLCEGTCFY